MCDSYTVAQRGGAWRALARAKLATSLYHTMCRSYGLLRSIIKKFIKYFIKVLINLIGKAHTK